MRIHSQICYLRDFAQMLTLRILHSIQLQPLSSSNEPHATDLHLQPTLLAPYITPAGRLSKVEAQNDRAGVLVCLG
jgi:hypothetical protein